MKHQGNKGNEGEEIGAQKHGWLMKGRRRGWETSSPRPLLHKCVEEREKTAKVSLHEPAVAQRASLRRLLQAFVSFVHFVFNLNQ
jgi:hypothetical protein